MDVKTSSISLLQPKEIDACEEHANRIRKPYTITRQRERWTEEEHKKFIEALQLYGRAWRRIVEHVGTKTAVQIRSHAQKFFSKVVRESGSNDTKGTLKAIEIPPPRPKRKPLHPYPRKLGNLPNKGSPMVKQHQMPPLQTIATCEQENRSPESVLSAIGSENLESMNTNDQVGCTSQGSSADGSNDRDDSGQSLTVTVQEENKLPLLGSAVPKTVEDQPQTELDECPNVESALEAQTPTLKLFGKLVSVTAPNKLSATIARDVAQHNVILSSDMRSDQDNKISGSHSTADCLQTLTIGVRPKDLTASALNAYPGNMPHRIYCDPYVRDNSTVDAAFLPPWWRPLCSNLPSEYVRPQQQLPPGLLKQFESNEDMQEEGSWTGSNTASIGAAGLGGHDADGADSNKITILEENKSMPCSSQKRSNIPASTREIVVSGRAFVPYKRCAVASEVKHSAAPSDEGESLAVRLCL